MTDTQNADQQRPQILRPNERLRLARRKHLLISLEVDCRVPLVALAQEVRAPVSTVFDDLKAIRCDHDFIILPKSDAADTLPSGWLAIQRRRDERQQRIIAVLQNDPRAPRARLARQLRIPLSTLANDMTSIRKRFAFTVKPKQMTGYTTPNGIDKEQGRSLSGEEPTTPKAVVASPQNPRRSHENSLSSTEAT